MNELSYLQHQELQDNFVFSPSSLTQFENKYACPQKWYSMWVTKSFRLGQSYWQLLGQWFEYLCLGESEFTPKPTQELMLKDGTRSIHWVRMTEQAEKFRNMHDPKHPAFRGEEIIMHGVKLTSKTGPRKRGIIDFITSNVETGRLTITDLKLTQDVTSKYGPQPWGTPEDIDPIQLGTYKDIYQDLFDKEVDTNYMVFDYGPRGNAELIDVKITKSMLDDINSRYVNAYDKFWEYAETDFDYRRPNHKNCDTCKLKCEVRYSVVPAGEWNDD